jgi:predicted nuclease of predicted toxin-antitoxin system
MRILIDECLDWRLKRHFPGHTAQTVTDMGWGGIKNGALLALAQSQFDVLVTGDKNLASQQNLVNLSLAVPVLGAPTTRLQDCLALVPAVLAELTKLQPGSVVVVK